MMKDDASSEDESQVDESGSLHVRDFYPIYSCESSDPKDSVDFPSLSMSFVGSFVENELPQSGIFSKMSDLWNHYFGYNNQETLIFHDYENIETLRQPEYTQVSDDSYMQVHDSIYIDKETRALLLRLNILLDPVTDAEAESDIKNDDVMNEKWPSSSTASSSSEDSFEIIDFKDLPGRSLISSFQGLALLMKNLYLRLLASTRSNEITSSIVMKHICSESFCQKLSEKQLYWTQYYNQVIEAHTSYLQELLMYPKVLRTAKDVCIFTRNLVRLPENIAEEFYMTFSRCSTFSHRNPIVSLLIGIILGDKSKFIMADNCLFLDLSMSERPDADEKPLIIAICHNYILFFALPRYQLIEVLDISTKLDCVFEGAEQRRTTSSAADRRRMTLSDSTSAFKLTFWGHSSVLAALQYRLSEFLVP